VGVATLSVIVIVALFGFATPDTVSIPASRWSMMMVL
jgi:hypothetical protein